MPTDDTISMVEHHLIWLRGGYLKTLDQPLAEIDKLIRAFGPRDDLMDTRSVFLLLQEESQQAKEITRLTSLLDPLTAAHRIHDRLADAQMAPIDERTTLLELDPTEQVEATELTLSILNRTLAEVR